MKLVWHAARSWVLAWLFLLAVQGALPVALVYLTRELVNRLVNLTSASGNRVLLPTFGLVALLAVLLLLTQALRGLGDWVRSAQAELVRDHVAGLIHARAAVLDLSFYDAPAYHDKLHQARVDALHRPVALLENLGALLQNGITLIAMAGVVLPFGWWIPLALVVSTAPALGVALYHSVRQHEWRVRATPEQRRADYYDWMLVDREAAAELRLLDLGGHFRKAFQALRGKLRGEQLRWLRRQAMAELLAGAAGLLITGAVMARMVWKAMNAHITLGDLALLYQAFIQGQGLMRTLLGNASQIYANCLFLENLFGFLALEPNVSDPVHPVAVPAAIREEIRFEDVRFRYPDMARWALDRFDFTVAAGQIVALVGANGAGKSTVVKLLCRFYDPTEGSIRLDGIDLRDLSLDKLRGAIAVLFQEPVRYRETVANSIAYGDWTALPDEARIQAAARAAGADALIARLPHGYEQVLGRWFGGVELSVGEWQRVALARAFLRRAPIIVLDEPTSAMDSWAETEWMARFRTLVAGRAAIVITHRFTTARQADVIHVMDEGRILESGTHAELLASGGRYAQSWREQMKDPRISKLVAEEIG